MFNDLNDHYPNLLVTNYKRIYQIEKHTHNNTAYIVGSRSRCVHLQLCASCLHSARTALRIRIHIRLSVCAHRVLCLCSWKYITMVFKSQIFYRLESKANVTFKTFMVWGSIILSLDFVSSYSPIVLGAEMCTFQSKIACYI